MSNLCRECLTRIDDDREYCSDCDKTARGMFEKLGFRIISNTNKYLEYSDEWGATMFFDKVMKYVFFDFDISLNYSILKTIEKQMEELGWNE